MTVKRGTVHSLIGPNGAGKTTTVNMITGIEKPAAGSAEFDGQDITEIRMLANEAVVKVYLGRHRQGLLRARAESSSSLTAARPRDSTRDKVGQDVEGQ